MDKVRGGRDAFPARRPVLIRTNGLEWTNQADVDVREVDRPNYDHGEDVVVFTHEARLEAGATLEYMDVRLESVYRPGVPMILACWDNPRWNWERYSRIPSALTWEA